MQRTLASVLVVAAAAAASPLAVASAVASGDDEREVVNFDFSWRHRLGRGDEPPGICTNGTQGVNYGVGGTLTSNVSSPVECCALCAASAVCFCWDWVSGPSDMDLGTVHGDCFTKSDQCSTSVPNPQRASGQITMPPLTAPPEAQVGFDDSAWTVVDAPHDMLIVQPYDPTQQQSMAYIPRNVGWYRKHFHLPAEWAQQSSVWLYIEGSFHITTVWLNGVNVSTHEQGYTSFAIRLDNVPGVRFGTTQENVLAVYVDASSGTGWWYEGGGLLRHNFLVRANPVHLNPTGGSWVRVDNMTLLPGSSAGATSATFVVGTEVDNDGGSSFNVKVQATVRDADGVMVGSASSAAATTVLSNTTRNELPDVSVVVASGVVQTWSVTRPYLYTVEVALLDAASGAVLDAVNVTAGARTIRWDADQGLFLNQQHVKLRGFCDHSSFAGVGGALGDRINLFRAQALRAVGGNSWRMAHNPPCPTRLDFMDRLGALAIDENRDYGGQKGQGGYTNETVDQELVDMADLVRRDRSHPSVMIWSFCNEGG